MKLSALQIKVMLAVFGFGLVVYWANTRQPREAVDSQFQSGELDKSSEKVSSASSAPSRDHIKRRIPKEEFQPPLPAPSDWKLNYGDDDDSSDEVVPQNVISGIKILPAEQSTASPAVAESVLVGASPTAGSSSADADDEESDEAVPLFNRDDLQELSDQGADVSRSSNQIGGAHVKLKDDLEDLANAPSPTPVASATASVVRFRGQARGYTLLPLMHPAARPMVERQLEILERANLQRAYLSVLADGTFGIDYDYLQQVIRRINSAGMDLILGIYFSNGPAMRLEVERERYGDSVNRYEPEEFREEIKTNQALRQQFLELFRQARSTFSLNQSLSPGNANIAYVMLEDNLDAESYQELRALADQELSGLTNFIRNPCPACYEGNDFDPGQDKLEFHLPEHLHALRAGDGYSMDGQSLFFPGEFDPSGLSVEDTKTIIAASQSQGLAYFALWRGARQGIGSGERSHPDQRNYEVPRPEHEPYEIELLRYGLEQFDPGDEDEDDDTVSY